jgi:hypothetical protein
MSKNGKAKQNIEGSRIGGKIRQDSDANDSEQSIRNSSASKVSQRVRSKLPALEVFGNYRATGIFAIAAVVLIIIASLIVQVLAR